MAEAEPRPTGNLEILMPVDKQVLGLEVSMKDSMGVAVVQPFDQL
jgi:hypothetical protein